MRRVMRAPICLAIAGLLASALTVVTSGTASADTVPTLQWPAVTLATNPVESGITTSPLGDVTVGCAPSGAGSQNLTTYGSAGTITRQISRTTQVDGVANCIGNPAADKNGDIYGIPEDTTTFRPGPNLLAYHGDTLKWEYPARCGNDNPQPAVGADGNVYVIVQETGDFNVHLVGLTPDVAPGQTQPGKVLDVPVLNASCGTYIFPYKTGIMVSSFPFGGGSTYPTYFSYGGKFLGVAPSSGPQLGYIMGADGRLFNWSINPGVPNTATVSSYDPFQGKWMWTTTVSTPGAAGQSVSLQPLEGGGVAALVWEQKTVDGFPAIPTSNVYKLVTLNATGVIGINSFLGSCSAS